MATRKQVSRKQYDLLVTHCPNWVELRWAEYSRSWHIGGVSVSGKDFQIENLCEQIAYAEQIAVQSAK